MIVTHLGYNILNAICISYDDMCNFITDCYTWGNVDITTLLDKQQLDILTCFYNLTKNGQCGKYVE